MTELFKKHKKAFIRQLGKGALDDGQLDALGKEMLGKKYIGTFAQDEMPSRSGYMIVNVDTSKKINTDKAHGSPFIRLLKHFTSMTALGDSHRMSSN